MQKTRAVQLIAAAALTLAVTAAVSGCSTSSSGSTGSSSASGTCSVKGKTVTFVGPLKSNPTMQIMAAGFSTQGKALGMSPSVQLSNDLDPQSTISLGQQAIAQGVDGLVTEPFDPSILSLDAPAKAANIPVVLAHIQVPQSQAGGAIADFYPTPTQYGAAVADTLGKSINGTGTVAVTESSFNTIENVAAKAFTAELKKSFPNVKVLAPQEEGGDPAKAISVAVSILQANPDVVAAYSTTGGGAVTWSSAAAQTSRKLAIAGMDYTRPNLDLLKAGKITALVAQPIYQEYQAGVKAIADYICGKKVKYDNPLPSEIVTSKNVQSYYDLLKKNNL
jgi:ribose transport system substrate-binding protein